MRSSEKYAQRPELIKSHPVFSRLLTLKQSLSTLEDLNFAISDESDYDDDESLSLMDEEMFDREQLWSVDRLNGLEADELDELLMDAQSFQATSESRPIPSADKPPKKKRKTDASKSTPAFDLVEPVYGLPKSTPANATKDLISTDAYGEATSLHHADQADKVARKKSLRFHTSKIASASARRQGARNNMVGGDDDIPYKERRKEQEARLAKESEKRAKTRGQGGDDLDDLEPEMPTTKRTRDDDGNDDGVDEDADGYYELVKRKTKDKKDKKKAEYEEAQAAARYVLFSRFLGYSNFLNSTTTGLILKTPLSLAHVPSLARYCPTKVLHPIVLKAYVTLELRRDRNSRRQRRKFRRNERFTRAALEIRGDMMAKSQAFRRLLRVFVWVNDCQIYV